MKTFLYRIYPESPLHFGSPREAGVGERGTRLVIPSDTIFGMLCSAHYDMFGCAGLVEFSNGSQSGDKEPKILATVSSGFPFVEKQTGDNEKKYLYLFPRPLRPLIFSVGIETGDEFDELRERLERQSEVNEVEFVSTGVLLKLFVGENSQFSTSSEPGPNSLLSLNEIIVHPNVAIRNNEEGEWGSILENGILRRITRFRHPQDKSPRIQKAANDSALRGENEEATVPAPFATEYIIANKGSDWRIGYYFLVNIESECQVENDKKPELEKRIYQCLQKLSDGSFGGKPGWVNVEPVFESAVVNVNDTVEDFLPANAFHLAEAGPFMSLSLFCPTKGEVESISGRRSREAFYYRLINRGGFHTLPGKEGKRRKSLTYFSEGSIFYITTGEPFLGRLVEDDTNGSDPVVRSGRLFPLSIENVRSLQISNEGRNGREVFDVSS